MGISSSICKWLLCGLFVLSISHAFGQSGSVSGTILDGNTATRLSMEDVYLVGPDSVISEVITDEKGAFTFSDVPYGDYRFVFFSEQYDTIKIPVTVNQPSTNLGEIKGRLNSMNMQAASTDVIPTVSLSDTESDAAPAQSVSGILSASRDAFVSASIFNFGVAHFKIRGYDQANTEVLINGVPVNDLQTGWAPWNNWSGLNDVFRARDYNVGLDPVDLTFGGAAGSILIDSRAGSQYKQKRFTYTAANRAYKDRVMLTYSTGMMKNNWAVTLSASRRWSNTGYIPGTYYDAWAYYGSVEKRIKNHSLNFLFMGTDLSQGKSSPATREAYDLAGTNYYNPNWGYQNGKVRNSSTQHVHQPIFILTYEWNINKTTNFLTSASYQTGQTGNSAISWYNSSNPRPDYYTVMPSYSYAVDSSLGQQVEQQYRNNPDLLQLDWDRLYNVNYISFDTIHNANGVAGNTVTGKRARYFIEDRRDDDRKYFINSVFRKNISAQQTINAGFSLQYQTTHFFKVMNDLLGADYYVDLNQFAARTFPDNSTVVQSDLNTPNHIIKNGDIFGYNYYMKIVKPSVFLQWTRKGNKFDYFLSAELSQSTYWRDGLMKTGVFPEDSYGNSAKHTFINPSVKGGITYKHDGRHYLFLNGAIISKPPLINNIYLSPRTRNDVVDNLQNQVVSTAEAGYLLKSPKVKARLVGYYTTLNNQTNTFTFYHDDYQNNVNYSMTNIDQLNYGTEFGIDATIYKGLSAIFAGNLGNYIYTSRPSATVTLDNDATILVQNETIYAKNVKVAGSPQTALTVGLSYRSKKFWFVNVYLNYFDNMYVAYSPARRTAASVDLVEQGSQQYNDILTQEQLPSAFTLNVFAGKSWRISRLTKDPLYLNLSLMVNNATNNTNFIISGYEQLRYDYTSHNPYKFPNKYTYSFGANYFLNVSVRM